MAAFAIRAGLKIQSVNPKPSQSAMRLKGDFQLFIRPQAYFILTEGKIAALPSVINVPDLPPRNSLKSSVKGFGAFSPLMPATNHLPLLCARGRQIFPASHQEILFHPDARNIFQKILDVIRRFGHAFGNSA